MILTGIEATEAERRVVDRRPVAPVVHTTKDAPANLGARFHGDQRKLDAKRVARLVVVVRRAIQRHQLQAVATRAVLHPTQADCQIAARRFARNGVVLQQAAPGNDAQTAIRIHMDIGKAACQSRTQTYRLPLVLARRASPQFAGGMRVITQRRIDDLQLHRPIDQGEWRLVEGHEAIAIELVGVGSRAGDEIIPDLHHAAAVVPVEIEAFLRTEGGLLGDLPAVFTQRPAIHTTATVANPQRGGTGFQHGAEADVIQRPGRCDVPSAIVSLEEEDVVLCGDKHDVGMEMRTHQPESGIAFPYPLGGFTAIGEPQQTHALADQQALFVFQQVVGFERGFNDLAEAHATAATAFGYRDAARVGNPKRAIRPCAIGNGAGNAVGGAIDRPGRRHAEANQIALGRRPDPTFRIRRQCQNRIGSQRDAGKELQIGIETQQLAAQGADENAVIGQGDGEVR